MERMYQVVEHKQNHLGTVLVDKADANKPLRRGELITAIHLMRCALTRSKTAVETPVRPDDPFWLSIPFVVDLVG